MKRLTASGRNLGRLLGALEQVRRSHDEPLLDALYERTLEELDRSRRTHHWYERDRPLYRREERAAEDMLRQDGQQKVMGIHKESGRLVATGLLDLADGGEARVTLIFPDTYPSEPPEAYVHEKGLLLPVELGRRLRWSAGDDCGRVLEKLTKLVGSMDLDSAGKQVKR